MSGQRHAAWADAVTLVVGELMAGFEAHYGYEPDDNEVVRRSTVVDGSTITALVELGAPDDLVAF
ncbi:hypothetical protein JOD54_003525 [Actinokineospora baliensis]|uniref:hypothetical protein n=1 Tax=Actinokineospora baliensis TaxID=547056 RepID=UPI0019599A0C|nr:hypothetical protein [Actinokineospora baliensis]MBM7773321.1 hypothetical protein [Actinokineospora baliensis]